MSHFVVAVFSKGPDEIDSLLAPYSEEAGSSSPYAVFQEDEEGDFCESEGKRGYWVNPKATWDWYTIGGRWHNYLRVKAPDGSIIGCNQARARNCDFSRDEAKAKEARRTWEDIVEAKKRQDKAAAEHFDGYPVPEYYLSKYGHPDLYVEEASRNLTYAFVTADGEWAAKGQMGWFGCDDASADSLGAYLKRFDTYLEKAREDDLLVTIVDCHI